MADLGKSIDTLSLNEIMRIWPRAIRAFIDRHLYCVGCPITDFHYLAGSAGKHGYDRTALRDATFLVIENKAIPSAPARGRWRSAAGDEASD